MSIFSKHNLAPSKLQEKERWDKYFLAINSRMLYSNRYEMHTISSISISFTLNILSAFFWSRWIAAAIFLEEIPFWRAISLIIFPIWRSFKESFFFIASVFFTAIKRRKLHFIWNWGLRYLTRQTSNAHAKTWASGSYPCRVVSFLRYYRNVWICEDSVFKNKAKNAFLFS